MDKQERWYADEMELTHQVVADVGANVGRLSQFFWDQGNLTNTVYSLEPLPQNIKRIKTRITRSKAKTWYAVPCAVTSQQGTVHMHRFHNRETGWNSMIAADDANPSNAKEIVVDAKPLSQLVPDATIVKIDIEGHEYQVLDEALDKLERAHTWAVELHMMPDRPLGRVIEQFMDAGFSVVAATQRPGMPGGGWVSAPVTPQLGWPQVPIAKRYANGDIFKMLHVIAKRQR